MVQRSAEVMGAVVQPTKLTQAKSHMGNLRSYTIMTLYVEIVFCDKRGRLW